VDIGASGREVMAMVIATRLFSLLLNNNAILLNAELDKKQLMKCI
jgi:hypothetical protein